MILKIDMTCSFNNGKWSKKLLFKDEILQKVIDKCSQWFKMGKKGFFVQQTRLISFINE